MTANLENQLIKKLQKILQKQNNLKIEGNVIKIGNSSIAIPQNNGNRTSLNQIDIGI